MANNPTPGQFDEIVELLETAQVVAGSIECLDEGIRQIDELIADARTNSYDRLAQKLGSIKECMRDARGPLTTL